MRPDCRERLDLAAQALAKTDRPIRERLRDVASHLIPCPALHFRDPENGALLEEIQADLTAVADPGDDGAIEMTLLAMSDAQADHIARQVRALHDRVQSDRGQSG